MTQVQNTYISSLDYIDFSYKGYNFIEASTLYEIKTLDIQNLIESVLLYPMGEINKIYPTGALIPIIEYKNKRIRIKIKWKVSFGKLGLNFFDKNLLRIPNSGIFTFANTEYSEFNNIIEIPSNANYLVIVNENGGTASIEYLTLYSVETIQPTELSKILLKEIEALKNTFKMWLFSRKGDYGRKIAKGGPVDWLLGKPIHQITTEEIKEKLSNEIKEQFYNITPEEILVEPNPNSHSYKITLFISDNINKYILQIPFILE